MLEPPAIPAETILACLKAEWGLDCSSLTFLPITGDASTAVFRAGHGEGDLFLKLRRGQFNPVSVLLPKFLADQGVKQVIAPIPTHAGAAWASLGEYSLILYPFVEGQSGYHAELSPRHWDDLGRAMRAAHAAVPSPEIAGILYVDDFGPYWRDVTAAALDRVETGAVNTPIAAAFAEFLRPRITQLRGFIAQCERMARELRARENQLVICHSDLHPGNLYLSAQGGLFVVDWDYPRLAPKERDLMFIGGGHGFINCTAEEEEARFYASYGDAPVDPLALDYYRCEQNLVEIGVQSQRIFSDEASAADQQQSLEIVRWLWRPGGTVDTRLSKRYAR